MDATLRHAENRRWRWIGQVPVGMGGSQGNAYQAGRLRAIVSRDGPNDYWHLSVSKDNGNVPHLG